MTIEYKDSKRIVGLSYTAGSEVGETSGTSESKTLGVTSSRYRGGIKIATGSALIGQTLSPTKGIKFELKRENLSGVHSLSRFEIWNNETIISSATVTFQPDTKVGTSYAYVEFFPASTVTLQANDRITIATDGGVTNYYTFRSNASGTYDTTKTHWTESTYNAGSGGTWSDDTGIDGNFKFTLADVGDVKPTNVQDNSIMVEKDTANRYWFDSDNTGGLKQTTFADDYDRTRISNEYAIDMTAKPDGSKLFVTFENQKILEYTLSTAGDLTTISQTGDYTHSLTNPKAITFKPDGTRMFLGHYAQELIRTYSLSVAWDIDSTITEIGSGVDLDVNAHGIRFSEDGLFMFISDDSGNLKRHNLATAYTVRKSVDTTWNPTEFTNIQGFDFSDSGKKLFCVGNGAVIYEYSLATAWDISNVTFVTSKTVTPTNMNGLVLSNNSSRLFVVEQGTGQGSSGGIDTITQFNIASQVWNAGTKTPAEIGDLKVHYDATVGVTASSNSVSAWADQSGNGKTLSSVSNPTRVEAGQNGKDYIDFNSSKSMRASGLSEDAPRPFTMVAVINPRNTSDQTIIRWGQSPYLALYQYPVNTYYISGGSDVGLSDSTLDGSWNVFFMDFKSNADGGTLQINLDTANAVSGDIGNNGTSGSGGNSQPSTLHVGINGTNNNWYGNCRYAEIIIFDRVITAYEKEQLFNHLKTKWGL